MAKKFGSCLFLMFMMIAAMTQCRSSQFLDITVTTNEPSYVLREIVQICGNVTYENQLVDDGLVGIHIKDSLGASLVRRTIPTGTALSGNWGVEVTSVILCKSDETPIDEAKRGKFAYFLITVINNRASSRDVIITINVYDNVLIPLGAGAMQTTIAAGKVITCLYSIWIERWASVGKALACANVYDVDGYPFSPEKVGNFTIIISEYEEAPHDSPPEQPVHNGTYEMQFRLSPEPHPGIYEVRVRASYHGWKASATTTFLVEDTVAPPWASFTAEPPMAGPNRTIRFDGSFSSPEGYNDTITSCMWDFGDSQNSTGIIVEHSYPDLGNYTVTLNVTDSEGFWNTTSKLISVREIHDVALTSIECPDEVYSNWLVTVTVSVKNKGTFMETFNVTVYYNSSIRAIKTVTDLDPLGETILNFHWNTTGLPLYANCTVTAQADILINETVTEDNSLAYGPVLVKGLGDIDGDRDVDIYDIILLCQAYGSKSGDENWDIRADIIPNGEIDIYDVVKFCDLYGKIYP